MVIIYTLCLLSSIGIFFWLYITDVKKSLGQNIMLIIMTLSDLGYLSLSVSQNLEQAILSTKIIYLGGCFLPMLYFFIVCEVCHVGIKKAFKVPMILFQIVIYVCVLSIGYKGWYYTDAKFAIMSGTSFITKEYGPTHIFYPIMMCGYFIASVVVSFISIFGKKTVNFKELSDMVVSAGLAICCYLIQRMCHFTFDIMPLSYIILMIGTVIPTYHSNLFTVTENIEIVREQLNSVGFITFDKKLNYMGCNGYALNIFGELKDCTVGRKIIKPGRELKEIIGCVKSFSYKLGKLERKDHVHEKAATFAYGGRSYDSEIHTLNNVLGRCVGYTVVFHDETEHYKAVELSGKYQLELEREVEEKTKKIRSIQTKTITGMAQMVESRDMSTGGHIKRTSDVVRIFAARLQNSNLGFDTKFLNMVIRSAPMHDLGKIGVDDAVLRKQSKFTDEEYEKMKQHSEIGYRIVTDILTDVEDDDFVRIAQNVAHYHHEKVNGRGYPEGLKGEEIPVEARIMALADVFDALVSKRCYKDAFSYDEAFGIIQDDSGTHFDVELASIFLSCRKELEYYYDNCEK